MKKLYLTVLIAIALIAGGAYGYMRFYQANYAERLFADVTGLNHYALRSTIYTEHDAYTEATINNADKVLLLKRYSFKKYPVNWKLKATCPFIPDNDRGFLYYQGYKKQKPHGYTLCFLQPVTNVVIVYEYREN